MNKQNHTLTARIDWENQSEFDKLVENVFETQRLAKQALEELTSYEPEFSVGFPDGTSDSSGPTSHKVMETPKGLYIDDYKLDFVLKDSISVRYEGGLALVTLTLVADSFEYKSRDINGEYRFNDQ